LSRLKVIVSRVSNRDICAVCASPQSVNIYWDSFSDQGV